MKISGEILKGYITTDMENLDRILKDEILDFNKIILNNNKSQDTKYECYIKVSDEDELNKVLNLVDKYRKMVNGKLVISSKVVEVPITLDIDTDKILHVRISLNIWNHIVKYIIHVFNLFDDMDMFIKFMFFLYTILFWFLIRIGVK